MTTPMVLEEQMQDERLARAQMALLSGQMHMRALDVCTWSVASKGNQYTVAREGPAWTCTCPDFTGRCRQHGLRCKHIEAVRCLQPASPAPGSIFNSHVRYTEDFMPATPAFSLEMASVTHPGLETSPTNETLWRLRQPLDMNRVKRRQAPGMGSVPYLEGFDVIEAANELFSFAWSFELLSQPSVMRWERTVTFYDQRARKKVPVLGEDGNPLTEVAGIVYLTGKVSVELAGKPVSHADVGRCVFTGDTSEALDMAIAGAATDCLKRCFRQMGEQFGNSLYDKEIARTAGLETGGPSENGSGHPTAPAHPPASAQPEALQYRDGTTVEASNNAEVGAFNTFKAEHQTAPASRDALRAWSAGKNGKK